MNLLLIRHAHALPAGEGDAADDDSRPLSDDGQTQCPPLARAIDRLGVRPEIVATSPLLRARQTAAGLVQVWEGSTTELRIAEELAPGFRKVRLAKMLRGLTAETVALVAHQPDLGEFAAWLIGGKKAWIDLAKAGAAFLVSESVPLKGSAALKWLVTPEWCNAVGK